MSKEDGEVMRRGVWSRRLTQRFSRRSVRNLRAACNPRGLLAGETDSEHGGDNDATTSGTAATTYSPFLTMPSVVDADEGVVLAEFEFTSRTVKFLPVPST